MTETSKIYLRDGDRFRTFGRAKGRPLSPLQNRLYDELYPKISLPTKGLRDQFVDITDEFEDVWFEIGFGGSEHLLWQAQANPNIQCWGAEPFENGVAKALRGISDDDLTNVRLHHGDARDIISGLPEASLGRVFVLFPDPWHKTRHHKRRLINEKFIEELHRIIRPGGTFRFASDIIHYVDWTLTRLHKHGGFTWSPASKENWRTRPDDWPGTRYEAKAGREGRECHYFEFTRV